MKLLLISLVFFSYALVQDVGVGAGPNTDTVDATTSGLTGQVLGLIGAVPGLGLESDIGKTAMNVASGLGTNALSAVNTFKDRLSFINNLSQMDTNVLSSIVNSRTGVGPEMITSGTNAIQLVIDVLHQLMDRIKSLASDGTRISSSLNVGREGSVRTRSIFQFPPR